MNFKVRRRLTYITISFYFFCGGVEYAVVFPTIWAYLQDLGARDETLLGFAVAAFSVSAFLAGPLVGKWFDKTRNARAVLITTNVFEVVGSVMYFAAVSPWFVVCSRFVCGIGSGAATVVVADIAHSTNVEERTPILSKLQACRQIGLMSGPIFNLLLQQFNFNIWNFPVNPKTSPGLFMALVGVILETLFVATYFNLGRLTELQKVAEQLHHSYDGEGNYEAASSRSILRPAQSAINSDNDDRLENVDPCHDRSVLVKSCENDSHVCECQSVTSSTSATVDKDDLERALQDMQDKSSDNMIECAENLINSYSTSGRFVCSRVQLEACRVQQQQQQITHAEVGEEMEAASVGEPEPHVVMKQRVLNEYREEFLRDEIIVILGVTFISFFAQTSFETIVTPLTQTYYNFGVYENSLLFLCCGLEILVAFLVVAELSKKFEDRLIILVGILCLCVAMSWFLIFLPRATPGDWSSLYYFAFGIFIDLLGISFLVACSVSLFSKLISKERQGVAQGLRRSVGCAGTIMGPLWGGAVTSHPVILFSIPLGLVLMMTVLFIVSYSRLQIVKPVIERNSSSATVARSSEYSERTPLLAHRESE